MSASPLSVIFITMLLFAHAPAQAAELPARPKATVKKPKGKSPAQFIAAYTPKVKAAMAVRWADALAPRMSEFATGNVSVTFKLDADGKVTEFTVIANTSNEAFAKFCEQFVRETTFEKPPAGALTDGLLEIPFTFTLL
jgi:TonB family protein